jgi:Tol biopolymer transport system component
MSYASAVGRMAVGVALATLTVAGPVKAQEYFGQNQVQYRHFDWRVLETEHFLVHYYPDERTATMDAARMAERSYARLSRVLDHQFREKKPIVLFASRADFGQNNVTGDLGEGTGGVTDILRQRNMFFMPGDYRGTEHVLTHEMVHQFQYDVFARGKAGANIQAFAQVDPPLWFMEGMAEYLSIGPHHPLTDTWVRDAALNGKLPSIEQMTQRPDVYFPYRYGEALWEYVGERWGDESIGQIMNAVPSVGVERAIKRELGLSLEDLSDEWKEAMQQKFLPPVAQYERPRKFAQALLSERRTGGQIFLAPALSPDGKYVVFLSNGSLLRGQVFIDLWLGDARTGKRIKRLVKSTTNTDAEELGILFSQSAFSPDGKTLAYTGLRKGKEVLYLLDVKKRNVIHRFDLPVETVSGPSFSPDGRRIVFSGGKGGLTDLYVVDLDGNNFRQLTNDRYGDFQPQWSPDGNTIAFATDRGPETDFNVLRFSKWRIALYDLPSGRVDVPAGQGGLNVNPQWAPDGRSIAYVSDRTGVQNVFLYDLDRKDHFQLTNVIGGVLAITETSPVISWAKQADRLAFNYYENGDYTVWAVDNPRLLRKGPYREPPPQPANVVAAGATPAPRAAPNAPAPNAPAPNAPAPNAPRDSAAGAAAGTTVVAAAPAAADSQRQRSLYRTPAAEVRESAEVPATSAGDTTVVSVARLLDSASLALPDTTRFKDSRYHPGYQPEYVARPSIGYVGSNNYGRGVYGGTTIVLSDLLGNQRLAFSGQVNGRPSEAQVFVSYANLSHRLQYTTGVYQTPYYFIGGGGLIANDPRVKDEPVYNLVDQIQFYRYLIRQAFAVGMYPLNRFTRFELGADFSNIDRTAFIYERPADQSGFSPFAYDLTDKINAASLNFVAPYVAYVSDNTLFGYTGPLMGRRYRAQVQQSLGSFRWLDYSLDYRRYDPIIFNFLTVATRLTGGVSVGRDELAIPKYIGNPSSQYWLRGYDRQNYFNSIGCNGGFGTSECGSQLLLGSRAVVASAELRFPLIRRLDVGLLPISLPPLEGLFFYDAGTAWSGGQDVHFRRPPTDAYDFTKTRYLLTSYGAGIRLNLFNFAILRWDYAIPQDRYGGGKKKGFWQWSLGPSF